MRKAILGAILAVSAASTAQACNSQESCVEHAKNLVQSADLSPSAQGTFGKILTGLLEARTSWEGGAARVSSDVDKKWCPNNSYWDLVPVHQGTPKLQQPATWSGSCWQTTQATLSLTATGAHVDFHVANPSEGICDDVYMITTPYSLRLMDISTLNNERNSSFDFVANEAEYVKSRGVDVLLLPCGIIGTIESLIKTAGLFINTPEGLEEQNAIFLSERHVFPPMEIFNTSQPIDASLIRSGDYLAIARFDGLDPMVMFGTGGRTGHSAVAVWEGDELYVCESTAANPFGKVYWPPPYGIIRTPYSRWIQLAHQADYHIGLLPIAPDHAKAFDETKFWAWFKGTMEGQPYGFHNFIYSFLDTADPMANLPKPFDDAVATWLVSFLDRLLGDSGEVNMYSIFTAALNQRLKTNCRTMDCIFPVLLAKNLTLGEATAIPEQDEWKYDDGKNFSRVCSAFAADCYMAAGVFPWKFYESTEQTPKDNYQMGIWDGNYFDKTNCPIGLQTTPKGTYCQLMGTYKLPLNDYNAIPPYKHMNNHCPSQWPDYVRCPAGNPQCC